MDDPQLGRVDSLDLASGLSSILTSDDSRSTTSSSGEFSRTTTGSSGSSGGAGGEAEVPRTDEDECLILASDGLWDVMTNEEVGEVARHILRRRRRSMFTNTEEISAAQAVADHLTEIAYGRNSSDNISIIVVDLKMKRKRQPRQ
ncbi:hypothetical protein ACLB2K_005268 [Fragaria x ananassa]